MFSSLFKAAVAVATSPVSIAADVITLGGALTDKDEPYTVTQAKTVYKNLQNAVDPDKD